MRYKNKLSILESKQDDFENLGSGYGYEIYSILSWNASNYFTFGNTNQEVGTLKFGSEQSFNKILDSNYLVYFIVQKGTKKVEAFLINNINKLNQVMFIEDNIKSNVNFMFIDSNANKNKIAKVYPLYLIPNINYNGSYGLIFNQDQTVLEGSYPGFVKEGKSFSMITLPYTLIYIKSNAFSNANYIKKVVIKRNVKVVQENAFNAYTGKICIELPNIPTTWNTNWAGNATNILLDSESNSDERKERIVQKALDNFKYRRIGKEIEILGCLNPIGSIKIPDELEGLPVTKISPFAFYMCDRIRSIRIPDTVKFIGKGAFYGCTGIESKIKLNKDCFIGSDAFLGVSKENQPERYLKREEDKKWTY